MYVNRSVTTYISHKYFITFVFILLQTTYSEKRVLVLKNGAPQNALVKAKSVKIQK